MLTIEEGTIVYRETPLPWALRLFMLVLGSLIATCIPLPFILHADWGTPSPSILLAAVFILVPLAMGGFLVTAAVWSATELRLDPGTREACRILRGPFVNRSDRFPLADLAISDVAKRDSDDGPWFSLRVTLPGKRRVDLIGFVDRAEAERWRSRIDRTLRA